MSPTLKFLLTSRRVWIAVLAAVQTILFQFVPNFPPAVWQSLDGLAIVLMGCLTVDDHAATVAGVHHITGQPKS